MKTPKMSTILVLRSELLRRVVLVLALGLMVCLGQEASGGTLAAWGGNSSGQTDVPAGDDFAAVAAGSSHSLALKSDGSLSAWGFNSQHQCDVPAGNDFVAIAAGGFHGVALKSDGSLAAWGSNSQGQCDVPAGNDFVAIAAGGYHSLALKSDGSLAAWGIDDGSNWDRGQVTDLPLGNDFVAIAAGVYHSLAVKSDGSLAAWGVDDGSYYDYGQVTDLPLGNDFVAIAADYGHSLALKSDGSLAAWGDNNQGQCDVPAGSFVAIAAGGYHNLAIAAAPMGTAITYQGRLLDEGSPADGPYDFEFKLYHAPNGGIQEGNTIDINDVDVIDGQFAVELDFGSDVFEGDARWLEIGVRPGDSTGSFTTLSPRTELTPIPYAIYAETAGGGNDWMVSGNDMYSIPTGDVGIGTVSPSAKLDVDGHINSSESYKLDVVTVLSNEGTNNIFAGEGAGTSNTTGYENTFVGYDAGNNNTEGRSNTFLGQKAGTKNTTGNTNTFVGWGAGRANTTGNSNTFSGTEAGAMSTAGGLNTFLGYRAGLWSITGNYNTFLGSHAGSKNQTGQRNTFLGFEAGYSNTTGIGNVFIGNKAGYFETGSDKLYIANGSSDAEVLIYGDFDTGSVGIGTTDPAAKLHIGGTAGVDGIMFPDDTLQTTAAGGSASVPIGAVIDWWRPNDSFVVPDGYKICDGSVVNDAQSPFNGQTLPDLKIKFVMGAYGLGDIGDPGGSSVHSHDITGSTELRTTTMGESTNNLPVAFPGPADMSTSSHKHTTAPHDHEAGSLHNVSELNLPPYVRLLKIMRIR